MSLLKVGEMAPAFKLPDQNGHYISLDQFQGQWVVLYFYPRAMTPGCTTQACDLRDNINSFKELSATVLGVSPDKSTSLKKFEDKENLNFTLLGDEDHTMAETYGAWQEKSMYGKTYMGMARMTYIIDPKGKISYVFPKVNPKKHLGEVLDWLRSAQSQAA